MTMLFSFQSLCIYILSQTQFIGEEISTLISLEDIWFHSFLKYYVCVCMCVHTQYHGFVLLCSVLKTLISLATHTL